MKFYVGQEMSLLELSNSNFDGKFKTKGGRVEYEGTDYPNRASGWWCIVSRLKKHGKGLRINTRRLHTDTRVIVTELYKDS